jgi:hypothetical protein
MIDLANFALQMVPIAVVVLRFDPRRRGRT